MQDSKEQFEIEMILSNPFYCVTVDPAFSEEHEYLVTEEQWIAANKQLILEIGAEKYLERLLENLKGNYVITPVK